MGLGTGALWGRGQGLFISRDGGHSHSSLRQGAARDNRWIPHSGSPKYRNPYDRSMRHNDRNLTSEVEDVSFLRRLDTLCPVSSVADPAYTRKKGLLPYPIDIFDRALYRVSIYMVDRSR